MNTLSDLNNILFKQLDRLDKADLNDDSLIKEIGRSKAVVDVTKAVVENAELMLRAQIAKEETFAQNYEMPELLCGK